MDRLTERTGGVIVYTGKHTKLPGIDCAASMRVAATRDVMQRLADYEDTGLTPEQVGDLVTLANETVTEVVQSIAALAPQVAQAVRGALQTMTPEQVAELLQVNMQKTLRKN